MADSEKNAVHQISFMLNRKIICRVVLIGTYLFVSGITLLVLVSISLGYSPHVLQMLLVCAAAFLYITIAYIFFRLDRVRVSNYMLVFWYLLLGTGIVYSWGINTPIGTLIFALAIVLAGILICARCALSAAGLVGFILIAEQAAEMLGWYMPNTTWSSSESGFGDVAAYCVVFAMMALVSWLYNREMERSQTEAKHAQGALLRQKATLRLQVKKRTAQLHRSQLEELRQMYRFADLGQLGVTLLHDLANHLTALTLEIEGMKSKKHAKAIERAREITGYLEKVVDSTRQRLQGNNESQSFDIVRKTSEVVTFLGYKASNSRVIIDWKPPAQPWRYVGDVAGYNQVIAIILSNAIDAYNGAPEDDHQLERRVAISMRRTDKDIIITISDWGKGIVRKDRKDLFKPFRSTKKTGLGIGLFIARQTVEANFGGTVTLNRQSEHTEFIIRLSRDHEK